MSKRKKEVEFTIEDMHKSDYESRPFRVTTDYNEDTQRIVLDYAQKYNGVQSGNSFAFNSYDDAQNFTRAVHSVGVNCSVPQRHTRE